MTRCIMTAFSDQVFLFWTDLFGRIRMCTSLKVPGVQRNTGVFPSIFPDMSEVNGEGALTAVTS